MSTPKPPVTSPVTFAGMLVRAQRRFEAVGRATAMIAFPGVELQRAPIRARSTPSRSRAATK